MIILKDRSVYLEVDEPMPVFCACSKIYQPPIDSDESICPACRVLNHHEDQSLEEVDE
jgi:hypothetical protein